jgi:hypothetical protein
MKKLYIFAITMISVTGAFAQGHNKDYNNDHYRNDGKQWAYNQHDRDNRDNRYDHNDGYYKGRQYLEKDRRAAIDRVNRDYDERINRFRRDRAISAYERDRRIAEAQRERQTKIRSFGTGMITGAVAALIAGVLLSK